MTDNINHPAHYCGDIETIDFIRDKLDDKAYRGYCLGNVIKYISRYDKKGDEYENLAKAEVYLGWALKTYTATAPAEPTPPKPQPEQKPKPKPHAKKSKIDDGKIRALYEGNRSVAWIADDMGIAPQTVINHLTKMGIYKSKRVIGK